MKITLPAALGGKRYRGLALVAPVLLVLLSACIPVVHGSHYRASVPGQDIRHHGVQCGDTYGAGEVVEVRGPAGLLVVSRMRPITDASGHRLGGQVGIQAPAGMRVVLGDSGFVFRRIDGGNQVTERALATDSVWVARHGGPWSYNGDGGWGIRNAAFSRTIDGGERGRIMWIDFDAGPADPRPRELVLRLPPLTYDGGTWAPGAITWRHRRLQPALAPFNC